MKTKEALEIENCALRLMLGALVCSCTPPQLPGDKKYYGVRMPDKELLEKARNLLEGS